MFEEDQPQNNQSSTSSQPDSISPADIQPASAASSYFEPVLEAPFNHIPSPDAGMAGGAPASIEQNQMSTEDLSLAEISSSSSAPVRETIPAPPPVTQFDTPEMAKKGIIEEATKAGGSTEEELYVMSDKFRKTKTKADMPGKKSKKSSLLIIILVLILVIIGVAAFYLWTRGFFRIGTKIEPIKTEQTEAEQTETEVETPPALTEEEVGVSEEKTLSKELKSEEGEVISRIEFHLPEGAIDPDMELDVQVESLSEETEYEKDYKIIGGLYRFSLQTETGAEERDVADLIFEKPCNMKIFYNQSLVEEKWQSDLTIGYFKDGIWTSVPCSVQDTELTASGLEYLSSDTWAVIVDKVRVMPEEETFKIAPNIFSSLDTDSDGLTDIEEGIFKTEINNPDSDADGSSDGQEIIDLNDPMQTNGVRLASSGLINIYTNPTYSYSFFYPVSWLSRAIPETDNQEILVITNTGEFFSVTVENNPESLSPKDWYLRQSPHIDEASLYSETVNDQDAVWNPEHLTIYISKDNKIYIISYNVGTEEEANFKTTFEMLINSFQFVVQSQGRLDGTLIKYPDQPGVYLIQGGQKRAFASGEIFEKLGFKWEDVIEIPVEEIYPDGLIINNNVTTSQVR